VLVKKPEPQVLEVPQLGRRVRVTFYQPVHGQTDDAPSIASCGPNREPWRQVAVSRDLFYTPDGHKRCGETVEIVLDRPVVTASGVKVTVVRGVIWDTMHPRYRDAVDVLVGPDEPALRYGVVGGWLR